MPHKEIPAKQARLPESAQVYDFRDRQYVVAYRKDFKRVETIDLIKAVTFNASVTTFTGKLFEVIAYARALIFIDLAVASSPTDILFSIEFSHNRVDWFKYMRGPFGDLRYEDAAGAKTECLDIPILAPFMRGKAVATGTDGTKLFTATLRAVLNG